MKENRFGFIGSLLSIQTWHMLLIDQFAIESSGPVALNGDGANYICYAWIDADTEKTIRMDFWFQGRWNTQLRVIYDNGQTGDLR